MRQESRDHFALVLGSREVGAMLVLVEGVEDLEEVFGVEGSDRVQRGIGGLSRPEGGRRDKGCGARNAIVVVGLRAKELAR